MDNSLGLYIVGGFFIVNLLLGLWAGKTVSTIRDYAIGNARWNSTTLVMTYLATHFGGLFLIKQTETVFNEGIIFILAFLGVALSEFFVGQFISRRFSTLNGCLTVGDLARKFYGKYEQLLVGILITVQSLIMTSIQIEALSIIFKAFLNIDGNLGILLSGILVTVYTATGGIKAVTMTDILQFALMVLSFFVLANIAVAEVGGVKGILENIDPSKFDILNAKNFPKHFSYFILNGFLFGSFFQATRFQRILMCDSQSQMKKVFRICALGSFIMILSLALLSFAGSLLYPDSSSTFVFKIYSNLIPEKYHPLISIGLLSFVFSSGDSYMHVCGLSIYKDLLVPILRISNEKLRHLKLVTFLVGVITTYMAYNGILSNKDGIGSVFVKYTTSIIIPFIAPMMLGIIGFKTYKRSFWISALSSFSIIVLADLKLMPNVMNQYFWLFSVGFGILTFLAMNLHMQGDYRFMNNSLEPKYSTADSDFSKTLK